MQEFIDAGTLKRMFLNGVESLEAKKAWINELNVFPVPDGDTGTNMSLTLMSAVRELQSADDNAPMDRICSSISMGTLRGARGNSGVIMSQLCRGFTKIASQETRLDKKIIADAMAHAVTTAYKAVMKPKEGTILTVSKAAAGKAAELAGSDITMEEYFRQIIKYAEYILGKTPSMLPVLAEAGVVDSGGQGLVEFLKGVLSGYLGKTADISISSDTPVSSGARIDSSNISTADIKYGYCTEFIIMADRDFTENDEDDLKAFLSSIGDSLVVVAMDNIVKVHVHTNHPGEAFEKGLTYGQLTSMKVDNMRQEHHEKVIMESDRQIAAEKEAKTSSGHAGKKKDAGFVAVCAGEGLIDIYCELKTDEIIQGGQTMNPSTEDILAAINRVDAETVYIFPNNSNIIMAAQQAKSLCSDRNIVIIPTNTVLQGITALISYNPDASAEENTQIMTEAIASVKSAEITYAVRDTELYGKAVQKDDYMGIGEGRILAAGKLLDDVTLSSIRELADEDSEIITIYYGKDVEEEDADKIADIISSEYPDAETETVYGGQPIYYYFVSVE